MCLVNVTSGRIYIRLSGSTIKSRMITRRALSHAASYSASRRLGRSIVEEFPIQTRCQQCHGIIPRYSNKSPRTFDHFEIHSRASKSMQRKSAHMPESRFIPIERVRNLSDDREM